MENRLLVLKQHSIQSHSFGRGKGPCGNARSRSVFLLHSDPSDALFWSQNRPVDWSSDPESRGPRFDFRLARVTSGSLFGHVGVTCSSILGHVGTCLRVHWGRFRMGLRGFREKVPTRSTKQSCQTCPGVCFLSRGSQNKHV